MFLAALSLLAEAAADTPLLALVDDAHWLDDASAAALTFVARRIQDEPVALLFAAREGEFDVPDLPELHLGGLDRGAAAQLLAERLGSPVPAEVGAALVARTGGNPLALLELPETVGASALSGAAPLPATLPVTEGVERVFLDRARRLPSPAQTVLLVAADDDSGQVGVVRRAADALGADEHALDVVERSGLVQVRDGRLELRHPLVRSAVYGAATSRERRRAHAALAGALTDPQEADRHAWHRAAASAEPDEAVAGELEAAAERARHRGGQEAASAALERAAELTPEPGDRRAQRRYGAALLRGLDALARGDRTSATPPLRQALALAEPVDDVPIDVLANLGLVGLRGSHWWLAAGWALHPVWDIALHYVGPGRAFAPETYTITCLSFDLVVAAYVAVAYRFGLVGGRTAAARTASVSGAR